MGLFSAISSALSSIGHAIYTGISNICSAIGGALSTAATAIGNFANIIIEKGPILFPKIEPLRIIITVVGAIVGAIAEALGLKQKEKDDPEELGMKAEQADKKPEDFESTEAYIKYLHDEVKVDEEKKKKLTEEEQAAYSAIGSKLYLDATTEKLGLEKDSITPEMLLDAAKLKLSGNEIVEILRETRTAGIEPNKVSEFLHGKTKMDESTKVSSAMSEAFSRLEPEMSKDDIMDRICDMKQELSDLKVY